MRSLWIAMLAAGMPLAGWSETVSFDISGAVEKDVVMEKAPGGKAESFGDHPEGFEAFVEEGYLDEVAAARGLPPDRKVKSTQPGLGTYRLLAYNKPNVIELSCRAEAPAEEHSIKVPAKKYKQIGLLVSSVDGDSSFTIKLRYSDGTEQVLWWEADDWYETDAMLRQSQNIAIGGMDRVRESRIDKEGHYSLFEFLVKPDPSKVLDSIALGNDPNRWPQDQDRWAVVFAVNGQTAE
jgi:hypothetical protein